MWQLSVLSALVLASVCHAVPQQSYAGTPLSYNPQSSYNPNTQLCGQRNLRPQDGLRGLNNNEANYGEFPWVVSIFSLRPFARSRTAFYSIRLCVGSLIRPRVVLTAAHCVHNYKENVSNLQVRAGEWNIRKIWKSTPYQDKSVMKIETHEQFINESCQNDFALLILLEPIILGRNVSLVCLPSASTAIDISNCLFNGWAQEKAGFYQATLKKNQVSVYDYVTCQNYFQETFYGPSFQLHYSFLCVGDETGTNSYEGDSGAPLVCSLPSTPNQYVQMGIVIGGTRCNGLGYVKFYANIAAGINWIQQIIRTY